MNERAGTCRIQGMDTEPEWPFPRAPEHRAASEIHETR